MYDATFSIIQRQSYQPIKTIAYSSETIISAEMTWRRDSVVIMRMAFEPFPPLLSSLHSCYLKFHKFRPKIRQFIISPTALKKEGRKEGRKAGTFRSGLRVIEQVGLTAAALAFRGRLAIYHFEQGFSDMAHWTRLISASDRLVPGELCLRAFRFLPPSSLLTKLNKDA